MKSLAELAAIREKMKDKVVHPRGEQRNPHRRRYGYLRRSLPARVPVLNAFVEEIAEEG